MPIIHYTPASQGCGGTPTPVNPDGVTNIIPPLEFHICMGLNACKGHDRFGTNNCAGTGSCATAEYHVCHTLNNCKGQGGCGLYGDAYEQDRPGQNECSWQGSCAVPVQAERISTVGSNTGLSTWKLARKLFEKRMDDARRNVGDSPMPCGPTENWLSEQTITAASCGNSGEMVCSYGFNNENKRLKDVCIGKKI
jgi:hypothetical protein